MNSNTYSLTILLSKLEAVINQKLLSLKYDQTFPSVIHGINADGTYIIIKENQRRNVKNAVGTTLSPGQAVWVKMPCGRLHDMHICGLR